MTSKPLSILCLLLAFCTHAIGQPATHSAPVQGRSEAATRFLNRFTPTAISIARQYGIPPELTLAVSALETGWGQSHLAEFANNYFGLKAKDPEHEVFRYTTQEFIDGQYVLTTTSFRWFPKGELSFWAFAEKLRQDPRYSVLWSLHIGDINGWAFHLNRCGYATDPEYSNKILRVVRDYRLQNWVREFRRPHQGR